MSIKNICLILCALGSSSCITVPNVKTCAVAGVLLAGADCAWTNTRTTSELSFNELIEMLEPKLCEFEGCTERAGAIFMSSEHYKRQKTALEKACKKLEDMGSQCTLELEEKE